MQGAAGGDGGLFISHSLRDVPIPSGTSPAPPASPPPGCLPGHFLTCSPGIASAALPSGRAAAPPAGSGHCGKPSLPSRTASSTAHWRQVVWTLSRRQCPQGPQGTDVRESRKPSFKRDLKDRLVDGFLSRAGFQPRCHPWSYHRWMRTTAAGAPCLSPCSPDLGGARQRSWPSRHRLRFPGPGLCLPPSPVSSLPAPLSSPVVSTTYIS